MLKCYYAWSIQQTLTDLNFNVRQRREQRSQSCHISLIHFFLAFEHRFTKDDRDWGFNRFDEMKSLKGQEEEGSGGEFQQSSTVSPKALIVEDCVRIVSIIRLIKDPTGVLWHNFAK